MNVEELLAEARRRYPVGTQYRRADSHNGIGKVFVIEREDELRNSPYNKIGIDAYNKGYVYYEGEWAEIIYPVETSPLYFN